VISEARKNGVHLILSLVNNWEGYGGKKQYVQWAKDQGQWLNNEDDFFRNYLTKQFYKNHVKVTYLLLRLIDFFSIFFTRISVKKLSWPYSGCSHKGELDYGSHVQG